MGLSECFLGKKVLDQLKGGIKLLILTVLIYPGEISKGYMHKSLISCEPMDGLLWSLQTLQVWKN